MPAPDAIPKPRRGFDMEEVDGEVLLYRAASKKMIYLNDSASAIWQLCDGERKVSDIVEVLAGAYPDARAAVTADVRDALDMLVREGALQIEAGANTAAGS